MNNKEFEFEISKEQLIEIIGDEWLKFQKILNNCYCASCENGYSTTIVDYKIFVNDINDIILMGKCKDCGKPVNRYTESGEDPDYVKKIQVILKNN